MKENLEMVKKMEKENNLGKDEATDFSEEVQKITDEYTKKVDGILNAKENEIQQV